MRLYGRRLGLGLLLVLLAGLTWMLPPIEQASAYHDFADQRACRGLANCLDTASNVLFILAGLSGLLILYRNRDKPLFREKGEAWPYRFFFFGAVLIGLGSAYYHLAPDNDRLLWDRLAMMLTFMAWFAAIVSERVSLRAGVCLLPLLVAAGLGSALWWAWSETQGMGDLRFYLLMQLLPILFIPLLLWSYPPRYSGDRTILAVIGLYLLALLLDLGDHQVFALSGGWVSGHTLKHVIAALAVFVLARHLLRRQQHTGRV